MKTILIATAIAALAGCATTSPDVVHRYETQRLSHVHDATVLSVRPVTIEGSQSGIGSSAGAVAGGIAGSTVGGYHDSFVGLIIGAVIGGVIGNAVERGVTRENAVEIVVQLRNGDRRAIVQASGNETWAVGDPVVLVTANGRTRVARAPAPAVAPSAYREPVPHPAPQPVPVYPSSGPVPPRS